MRNKTINELTALENPRLTDTLPIWDGTEGKTKKVSLAKIPANVITPVDSLPESPNILDRVYRYNNKYYVGNESAQTLTELASKADIPTVVDTVADGNMNPVTSNAVYDTIATLSPFNKAPSVVVATAGPDTSQVAQWTATKDCWVTAGVLTTATNGHAEINLSRDGGTTYPRLFGVSGQGAGNNWPITLGFPVKKGWIVQIVGGYGSISAWI